MRASVQGPSNFLPLCRTRPRAKLHLQCVGLQGRPRWYLFFPSSLTTHEPDDNHNFSKIGKNDRIEGGRRDAGNKHRLNIIRCPDYGENDCCDTDKPFLLSLKMHQLSLCEAADKVIRFHLGRVPELGQLRNANLQPWEREESFGYGRLVRHTWP